jgi:hypothetical protein
MARTDELLRLEKVEKGTNNVEVGRAGAEEFHEGPAAGKTYTGRNSMYSMQDKESPVQ